MAKRQKTNSRAMIPAQHLEYVIHQAAIHRFPDITEKLKTTFSAQTLDRLEGTLRTFVGMMSAGVVNATQKFIAGRRGKSDRALRDDIRCLEALGLLKTIQNYDKSGRKVRNTYIVAPACYQWRKGAKRVGNIKDALVAATEGLTSRMMKRMNKLHEAYRSIAKSNLKQGTSTPERLVDSTLPTRMEMTPSRLATILQLVRDHGFQFAANCCGMTAEEVRRLWEVEQKSGAKPA